MAPIEPHATRPAVGTVNTVDSWPPSSGSPPPQNPSPDIPATREWSICLSPPSTLRHPSHGTPRDAPTCSTQEVAILLLSTSPVTIGVPLTPSALLVTAMSLACLPLASRLPAAGAAASLAVAWFAANSPYDLGSIAVLLPWGLCIMLLGRGLRRDMIYILAFATTLAHLSATPTWYLGLIQTATFGAPCMVIGEVIRHHRLQASAAEQERRHKLDQQRRLVVSELHDTVVRDLSHAVMIAEQARLADPHNTRLNQELAAITTPVRTAVEQLRRSLKAMSAAEGRRLPPPTGSLTPTTPDRHHPHRPGNPRAPRRPPDHSRHRPARQPQHRPGPPPTTRPHHRRAHQQRRQVHASLQHRQPHHRDRQRHHRVHVHQPH